ncbi:hypothetical protein ONZ45_g1806 [Pleurotus djamor]|nr:hypothetical protein ONZ45_g1806 [Pleurotus djamor]
MIATTANTSSSRKTTRPHASTVLNNEYQFRSLDRALAMRYMQALREGRLRGEPPLALQRPVILTYRPRMDMYDHPASSVIAAVLELPGLKKQDINLRVEQGQLVISGERRVNIPSVVRHLDTDAADTTTDKDGQNRHIPVQELKYGKYLRIIPLPEGTSPSQINATLGEGLLTVTWPRGSGAPTTDAASDMNISLHSAPRSLVTETAEEASLANATSKMNMD